MHYFPNRQTLSALLLLTFFALQGAGCRSEPSRSSEVAQVKNVDQKVVVDDLSHPWGMAFLPDGRLLITERDTGDLHIATLDGRLSEPIYGTPEVFSMGQGGLLDVALDPNYSSNSYVYLSYAKPKQGGAATTALGRGKLVDGRLENFQDIFVQEPWIFDSKHFGGRIVFASDRNLFLTLGERFQFEPAQDLGNHLGTIVRIRPDGSIPDGNPFVNESGAEPEIWSYGHRNIEAAAMDSQGRLWVAEMGPKGGDELNLVKKGENYGWPEVSWGEHYSGIDIPNPPTEPQFADAVKHWTPVISPSGMVVYSGEQFPDWQGDLLIGGLTAQGVVRVKLRDGQPVEEERYSAGARVRDVEQGPDGHLYILTDKENGALIRLAPSESSQ